MAEFSNGSAPPDREAASIVAFAFGAHNRRTTAPAAETMHGPASGASTRSRRIVEPGDVGGTGIPQHVSALEILAARPGRKARTLEPSALSATD